MLQSLPTTKCLSSPASSFDPSPVIQQYRQGLIDTFGPGTQYADALRRRNATQAYDPRLRLAKERTVVEGPWLQGAVIHFLERGEGDSQSLETDGLCSTIPLICYLASAYPSMSLTEVQSHVSQAASVLSTHSFARRHTLCAAVILASLIRRASSSSEGTEGTEDKVLKVVKVVGEEEADEEDVRRDLDVDPHPHPHLPRDLLGGDALLAAAARVEADWTSLGLCVAPTEASEAGALVHELEDVSAAVREGERHSTCQKRWGSTCSYPGSFMGALLAVCEAKSAATSTSYTTSSSSSSSEAGGEEVCGFAGAIRRIIRAGGCNCSRANLAGALLGAEFGFGGPYGVPLDWIEKTDRANEVMRLCLERLEGDAEASRQPLTD